MRITLILLIMQLLTSNLLSEDSIPVQYREVRVVDPDGKSIADAFIDCWLINDMYFWPTKQVPRIPVKTDQRGIARLKYPDAAEYNERIPVESIKMTVVHSDFRSKDVIVPVGGKSVMPFEIKLEPGISLSINAIDEKGIALKEPFGILISKMGSMQRWSRPSADKAYCRSISDGNRQIMLVQPRPDGLHRFSDVLTYHFRAELENEVKLEDVELLTGIPIRGKLSDKVPRPVQNGWVIAVQLPLPAGDSWDEALPSLIYYDAVDINADGTFQFPSMPLTGTVQLIAGCDGWVGLQEEKSPFVVGETFPVVGTSVDVELQMITTFDAKVRVVDTQGNPVSGVIVSSSPNQLFKKGGSTILGERFQSMPAIESNLRDVPRPIKDESKASFQGVSDENGMLTIRNLPRNRWSAQFNVWSSSASKNKIKPIDAEGKLPDESQSQVAFDIVVTIENNPSKDQGSK